MTVKEAAARLEVSVSLVYALVAAGELEHYRVGLKRGVIKIPEAAIEQYPRRRTRDVPPSPASEVNLRLKHLNL